VRKQWSHTVAVGPLSLEIPRGEILVLLGPSGSGKTTVLRLLGGFEPPDAGRIVVAGEDVTAVPPARRRCGMVFQHYALFPHLDPSLRERTRRELRALIKRVGITTIFVTHEQEEAFGLGDRVAVLQAGRLEQLATADELYEHPASLFVATFVGRANVLRGKT